MDQVRRLALPSAVSFVIGSAAAWLAREPLAKWLYLHARTRLGDSTTPAAFAWALVELSASFGVVVAAPLVGWQLWSLLAPVALDRARARLAIYLSISYLIVLVNPAFVRVLFNAYWPGPTGYDIDPLFYTPVPIELWLRYEAVGFATFAVLSSCAAPLFAIMRHHPDGLHPAVRRIVVTLGWGTALFVGFGVASMGVTPSFARAALLAAGFVVPLLLMWRELVTERRLLAALARYAGLAASLFFEWWVLFALEWSGLYLALIYGVAVASGMRRNSTRRSREKRVSAG